MRRQAVGVRLTWAWRVTHNNGQVLIGACGGKRADAEKRAHNAAQRMERFYAGAKTYRTQVLCRPKEEKSDG